MNKHKINIQTKRPWQKRIISFTPIICLGLIMGVTAIKNDKQAPVIETDTIQMSVGTVLSEGMVDVDTSSSDKTVDVSFKTSANDITKTFNPNEPGIYEVSVSATDQYGNESTKVVTVEVVDDEAPAFTNTDAIIPVQAGSTDTIKQLVKAMDNVDGDISDKIEADKELDTHTLGEQTLTLSVTDSQGNKTSTTATFSVQDTAAPEISIVDSDLQITMNEGDESDNEDQSATDVSKTEKAVEDGEEVVEENEKVYVDYSKDFKLSDYIRVKDAYDAHKNLAITITPEIDATKIETQTATITVTDTSGNTAEKTYDFIVNDYSAPVIELSAFDVKVARNSVFKPKDYIMTLTDNKEKKAYLEKHLSIESDVNIKKNGSYTVNYSVTDKAGNIGTEVLEVEVKDKVTDEDIANSHFAVPTSKVVDSRLKKAIAWAVKTANNNHCGYSQENRSRKNSLGGHEYDCSSFVAAAMNAGGIRVSSARTKTMRSHYASHGFVYIPASRLGGISSKTLQPGDILWRDGHTELYLGHGKRAGAHSNYDKKPGDSSGREISVKKMGGTWQGILRLKNQSGTGTVPDYNLTATHKNALETSTKSESESTETKTKSTTKSETSQSETSKDTSTTSSSVKDSSSSSSTSQSHSSKSDSTSVSASSDSHSETSSSSSSESKKDDDTDKETSSSSSKKSESSSSTSAKSSESKKSTSSSSSSDDKKESSDTDED